MLRDLPRPGLPMPRLTARRLTAILIGVSIFALYLISTLTAGVPLSPSLSASTATSARKPPLRPSPASQSSFKGARPTTRPSHPPPRQNDDAYGNSTWVVDPDGLSEPFSKDITLDDDRTLLPSLPLRQPVYCYFDPLDKTAVGENDTETELLLMWRRAWWARGFKPVILGPDEAKNNPLYPKLETLTVNSGLKRDLLRWLAWDTMEGGLLSHYTLFPMGTDYTFLPALRHGQYPVLARAGGLASGLFWGNNQDVHAALRKAIDSINADTASATTLLDLVNPDMIGEDDTPPVLAFYNATTIAKKYPKLLLDKNKPKFGRLRNQLINAHLQASWQNSYFLGIDLTWPRH
ncbi:hypothetical protein NQ176_g7922 [Zarea fungicola]|uniref:Uncharacterized protein n=1 Tax=Zarea fungicola TaxID=93591 RepID=A0ACC1MXK1_9HYPO|nr:hypothetical protein NQ176_g7922 [Lecanicillium fungicola]